MLILPTEKRLDWQHTPVMLFSLVLLNTLIFFLYQSGDNGKFAEAHFAYVEQGLLELEWPVYKEYLLQQELEDKAERYQELFDKPSSHKDLAWRILGDFDFRQELESRGRDHFSNIAFDEWVSKRELVNRHLDSVSFIRGGLQANKISVLNLLSYQFLHGDVMHLLGNMFFLLVCGFAVEAAVGHGRFLVFYLLTGIAGGLAHAFIESDSSAPLIGASGAVSGVMAMYLGIFRFKKIEFFYWFFIFVGYFRAPALMILPFYLGKELWSFFQVEGSNVAFMAHAGGFVAGALLIGISLLIKPDLVNQRYVEEDQDHSPYQEDLAKVYRQLENFQFQPALKSIAAMEEGYGKNPELAWLRCNILKIDKGPAYETAVQELWRMRTSEPRHLQQQAALWRENPELQQRLNEEELVSLGLRLATPEFVATARAIVDQLQARNSRHMQLGQLRNKVARLSQPTATGMAGRPLATRHN